MNNLNSQFNRKRMFITGKKLINAKSFSGMLLLFSAIIAMYLANSSFSEYYFSLLKSPFIAGFSNIILSMDAKTWVNEALMTIFFLLAGLEIKREVSIGELSSIRLAAFPIIGALGGMIVPAALYLLINFNGHHEGFGIPMATDIAFALAILLLLGNKIPISLKLFLITLAVADDIGAVIVIAIFYTGAFHVVGVLLSIVTILLMLYLNRKGVKALLPYMVLGFLLWHWFHMSGIHASISGIVLALTIPIAAPISTNAFVRRLKLRLNYFEHLEQTHNEKLLSQKQIGVLDIMGNTYDSVQSPLVRLEHNLIPISAFLVLPIFAFFNAGVSISSVSLSLFHPVSLGIFIGLVIGKPLGIFSAVYLANKYNIAKKPDTISWTDIFGASLLGGVGFTMSIFIGDIAFADPGLIDLAKISVIIGSSTSGVLGALWLLKTKLIVA
jgi:NhaA family Na+:H+ antiporter